MIYSLFKIAGSRKNTLNYMATFPYFPYFLKNTAYYYTSRYTSLPRNHSIIDSLPLVGRYGNEIESTLNADCLRRKETLNSVAGVNTSNDRKP